MKRHISLAATTLILLLGAGLAAPGAAAQDSALVGSGARGMTAEDAEALERSLLTNPDDRFAREYLIVYYSGAMLKDRSRELLARREQHIFWLIENHPYSETAGREADLIPGFSTSSPQAYQNARRLWLLQVEKHPTDVRVARNAAQFFHLHDRELGRQLYEKALSIDPTDWAASMFLAQSYFIEGVSQGSPEKRREMARKALEIRERAMSSASDEMRSYSLADVASYAFEAGDQAAAERYATELLNVSRHNPRDWNHGNAVHKSNLILGRLALLRGDVDAAKRHLLAAADTPGSPQLNSFGPNMALARELLEKGERETVIAYLEACGKFWERGAEELNAWIATIRGGGMPNFGANLLY